MPTIFLTRRSDGSLHSGASSPAASLESWRSEVCTPRVRTALPGKTLRQMAMDTHTASLLELGGRMADCLKGRGGTHAFPVLGHVRRDPIAGPRQHRARFLLPGRGRPGGLLG